jgi:N6-L-threonylcarbamoyladenine synthase
MQLLGTTRDDAVGEAFDKVAKMLGLPYPGGPLVDKFARQGDPHRFKFPIASMPGFDFSFSGIKTAVLYFIKEQEAQNPGFVQANLADLCASVQHTLVKTLIAKVEAAVKATGIEEVAVAGGVSANSALREAVHLHTQTHGWRTYAPKLAYCTDNAAMVAMAGWFKYLRGEFGTMADMPYARHYTKKV